MTANYGIGFDTAGNVGIVSTIGVGAAVGAEANAGFSAHVTNAPTLFDTTGIGASGAVAAGAGIGGSIDISGGTYNGGAGGYGGIGASVGGGAGAVGAGYVTYTQFTPTTIGGVPVGSTTVSKVNATDPNALYGPTGIGAANYVTDMGGMFGYRVTFENSSTATAPAQSVTITNNLNSNFDLSTFQLTGIGFGDNNIVIPPNTTHFATTVSMTYNGQTFNVLLEAGIHSDTGQVYATFQSIDPDSGLPPANALTGFLPPEDGSGRGDGYLSYTISPKANVASGTMISNVADIVFDDGLSIATDLVNDEDPSQGIDPTKQATMTIDGSAPISHVNALPVNVPATFGISWSGTDPNGPGIASYNVYESSNGGGNYTALLTNTQLTSTTINGTLNTTYAFYVVATDLLGNVQVVNPATVAVKTTTKAGVKSPATITLNNLAATYDGTAHAVTATTTPANLAVTLTYSGKTTVPINAGSYPVVATITNPSYTGTQTGTLVIAKAAATVNLTTPSVTYDGKTHPATATTTPAGLPVTFTYNGSAKTVPLNAGSYTVVATINSPNTGGSATGTETIAKALATITLTPSSLTAVYSGKPHPVTATTNPAKLAVSYTYNGNATAPTAVGTYPVVATITDPNHIGTTNGVLTITPVAPTATTGLATAVGSSGATLNGTVNPKGSDTMVTFQYGTTTAYLGGTTQAVDVGNGSANVAASAVLPTTTLTPGTPYHFRVVAMSAGGTINGLDKTFTTLKVPIFANAPSTPLLSASGAQVGFGVNPNGVATSVFFKYGTTANNLNLSTAMQGIGAGTAVVNVSGFLSGLLPNTQYFYELVTVSAAGTFTSTVESFTTLGYDVSLVAQPGDAAPGVAGGTFAAFHNPAINEHDAVAFVATLTLNTGGVVAANDLGIWADDNTGTLHQIARIGVAGGAPLANAATGKYTALGDPVFNNSAQVAYTGTLAVAAPVTKTTTGGVWSTSGGSLALVAQVGGAAPGTGGATFGAFTSVGLPDSGGTIILATLAKGTGIAATNNAGIWQGNSTADLQLVLRLGQTVGGRTISALTPLTTLPLIEGQTRNFNSDTGDFVCAATFTDKTTGIVEVAGGVASLLVQNGAAAPDTNGATFTNSSSPIVNTQGDIAFVSALNDGATDSGIWADDNTDALHLVARTGTPAPGTAGKFGTFTPPVYNNDEVVAFGASVVVGSGKTAKTTQSIWTNATGVPVLVTQQGNQAPGCATGATFAAFASLALPDQGGVVFIGTLTASKTNGVTTANNTGIWAVDNNGALQLVVRTGDVLNGKIVTALSFLPASTVLDNQSRNFVQSTGDLVYLATFSDKSTAIFNVVFP